MELPFTQSPGRRERQLRRRHNNPLFAWPPEEVLPEQLLMAQQADHEDLGAFRASLRDIVRRAAELPADAGSEIVLGLKRELERHFEQCCGLPENQERERTAIRRLIDVIMRTVRRHVETDPLAIQELDDETVAREIHFRLLEQPLVADLLHAESPIAPQDLTPTLLSASPPEVDAACQIFSDTQLRIIVDEAAALRTHLSDAGLDLESVDQTLQLLRRTASIV
ncbi:MAG: hypothetical protein WBG92_19050 [Thiohalocapsa sp.]